MPDNAELTDTLPIETPPPAPPAPQQPEPIAAQPAPEFIDGWRVTAPAPPAPPPALEQDPDKPPEKQPESDGKAAPAPAQRTVKLYGLGGMDVDASDPDAAADALARLDALNRERQSELDRLRHAAPPAPPGGGGGSPALESRFLPPSAQEKDIKALLAPHMLKLNGVEEELGVSPGRMQEAMGGMMEEMARGILEATIARLAPFLVTDDERPGLGVARGIAEERALKAEAKRIVTMWAPEVEAESVAYWMAQGLEKAREERKEIEPELLSSWAVRCARQDMEAAAKERALKAKTSEAEAERLREAERGRDERGRFARGGVASAGVGGRAGGMETGGDRGARVISAYEALEVAGV